MVSGVEMGARTRPLRLVWMTCLILFFSAGLAQSSALLDRVVAVVNKEVITWSELYRAMEFDVTGEMRSLSEAEKKKIFKESEMHFLESMVDAKLQMQAARVLDIGATREEISDAIDGIKKKYGMDEKGLEESLRKEGFTVEEYRKRLTEQIVLTKLVRQQVRSKIVVSEEEIADYMAKNKNDEYRVRQIFFKNPEKETDRNTLEQRAVEVMQRLKNGEDFAMLALTYSDDPSGKSGGEMGYIKKEHLGKDFLAVISQMPVGAISAPFWTERGLHIV
ncbi:MAG TPA: peptidylprolyl isomerase, partial [Thermodesulfovibrionales bacterium]|nr:peptidylprolyl isomerase [Thermodesulfovibrionales bacterium]